MGKSNLPSHYCSESECAPRDLAVGKGDIFCPGVTCSDLTWQKPCDNAGSACKFVNWKCQPNEEQAQLLQHNTTQMNLVDDSKNPTTRAEDLLAETTCFRCWLKLRLCRQ